MSNIRILEIFFIKKDWRKVYPIVTLHLYWEFPHLILAILKKIDETLPLWISLKS